MCRISSLTTFFYKRIFPVLFFAILVAALLVAAKVDTGASVAFTMLGLVAVAVYANIWFFVRPLLDQVFDDGDALVLKNRGKEERVAFSDIESVRTSTFGNPPRVTLWLKRPTVFGNKVIFIVPIPGLPGVKSDVVTGLEERVERAKTG